MSFLFTSIILISIGHGLISNSHIDHQLLELQWNSYCEVTPFASEKWSFKRGGLSSRVEINTYMFRFTLSSGLSRGGGLSSGWPLKRGSTVFPLECILFQKYHLRMHETIYFIVIFYENVQMIVIIKGQLFLF